MALTTYQLLYKPNIQKQIHFRKLRQNESLKPFKAVNI